MAKNKMIKKNCPFCGIQVAVACKTCTGCKHSFYTTKRNSTESVLVSSGSDGSSRRRTERVKREKPNYYDASEYEKKTKKKRLDRGENKVRDNRGRPPNSQNLKKKKKKAKPPKEPEDEVPIILTPEKSKQCSIILAELNRKYFSTTWRV